jgi:hypothetical protein
MRRSLLLIAALPVLAVDWAALHDILRHEPDVGTEYAALALSLPVLAALWLAARRWSRTQGRSHRS